MVEFVVLLLWAIGFFAVALIVLGVLWAPIACLICALIAHKKGLKVKLWTIRALVCSALMLLPWFYVVARVSDLSVPRPLTGAAYVVPFTVWLGGPILFTTIGSVESFSFRPIRWEHPVMSVVWMLLTSANLWTLFISLKALLRTQLENTQEFDVVYFWPWFLWILWWLVILVVILVGLLVDRPYG